MVDRRACNERLATAEAHHESTHSCGVCDHLWHRLRRRDAAGSGQPHPLNDTGMTHCADQKGNWSAECAKSRQDAQDGRDVNEANPDDGEAGFSFRKVCRSGEMAGEGNCPVDPLLGTGPDNWGCVYDYVTQLTWEAKTEDGGPHDTRRRFSNKGGKARDDDSDAAWLVDTTNAETLCGAANWRLPDVLELHSIVNYGMGAPGKHGSFIDPTFFPFDGQWETWTRNEGVWDPKRIWYVNFDTGRISFEQRFYPGGFARLVHKAAGSPFGWPMGVAGVRFIPSDDGTEVTDTLTGLIWRRCAAGMSWNNDDQRCDGTSTAFQWKDALEFARANHKGGWRIPNVKELISLLDYEKQPPAIDETAFPNSPGPHLSSTPFDDVGSLYIYAVYFGRGSVEKVDVSTGGTSSLRMVRRGRE